MKALRIAQRNRVSQNVMMALGLGAGSVLWSSSSGASEVRLKTVILPEHYSLGDDSQVILQLGNGDQILLPADKYVILEDGLLLVIDETAQASLSLIPVQGAIRTQLWNSTLPVMTDDGGVILTTENQPVWSGDGPAPRLFDVFPIQRYELAQNAGSTGSETGTSSAAGGAGGGLAGGAAIAAGLAAGIVQSARANNADYARTERFTIDLSDLGPVWSNSEVPSEDRFLIKGANRDEFIGYKEPLTVSSPLTVNQLVEDPLTLGPDRFNAKFNMSKGGDKWLLLGDMQANWYYAGDARLTYIGSPDDDSIKAIDNFGVLADSYFNMSKGGDNTLQLGPDAVRDGFLKYDGGSGSDVISMGDYSGKGGWLQINNRGGGNNHFESGEGVLQNGYFEYDGGLGNDTIQLSPTEKANVAFSMRGGTNYVEIDSPMAFGSFSYAGGDDDDTIDFGPKFAYHGDVLLYPAGGTNLYGFDAFSLEHADFAYHRTTEVGTNILVFDDYVGRDAKLQFRNFASEVNYSTFTLDAGDGFVSRNGVATITAPEAGLCTFIFGDELASDSGFITINNTNGEGVLNVGANAATQGGYIHYSGSNYTDSITLGDGIGANSSSALISLSNHSNGASDNSYDSIEFLGSVGDPATVKDAAAPRLIVEGFGYRDNIALWAEDDAYDLFITETASSIAGVDAVLVQNDTKTINFIMHSDVDDLTWETLYPASGPAYVSISSTLTGPAGTGDLIT